MRTARALEILRCDVGSGDGFGIGIERGLGDFPCLKVELVFNALKSCIARGIKRRNAECSIASKRLTIIFVSRIYCFHTICHDILLCIFGTLWNESKDGRTRKSSAADDPRNNN